MAKHLTIQPGDVRVTTRGRLPGADEYAVTRIGAALRVAPETVHSAHVKLSKHDDPAVAQPYVAQVNVDMRGRTVRAEACGATAAETVDLLEARLRRRLESSARNWEAVRARVPAPGEWRHGQLKAHRDSVYPRPPEERTVLRHKSFGLGELSVSEAADLMISMDYGFYLFTDAESGVDSVVYETPDGLRYARAVPGRVTAVPESPPIMQSDHSAAELTLQQAIERLNIAGQPFFRTPGSVRGKVLYRRYDGHYGLIDPAD
ncbi:sigma 54 modulation/S30EA ribosomal C-terminal domain-containing protein [Hoyosella sp. YIM 151337]|uniref:sigma 54 modulation/S30EA ribosomal C-terminal domain-containing protein n=1 Tax=Hoyosella sp. YIM 151337 TaxID=2992742 RepID=UPI002235D55B|nr:sigma 54 modulation/S30EA ribosomal C-terminal domain-containing protein [Hoyosella sp. YIM 151337]MCW4352215.1 sigma 54 modulation/S30EA ribosomal C-terminal domain-containing protein [Hoyosella sp. YIM 151337]